MLPLRSFAVGAVLALVFGIAGRAEAATHTLNPGMN
jgi:hypothetical protein